jgi:hypothetical protein
MLGADVAVATSRRRPAVPGLVEEREKSMGEFVRLEVADGVGTIRLDRPKMNAISIAVQEELRAAAAEATEREDVRAVVLHGGERVFAAGNDVKEMADMSYQDMVARSGPLQSAVTAIARIPKPVVAAVNGYALGGGCELALAADLRIAGERTVMGQPETLLGIIPGAGGTQRLARLVGPSAWSTGSSPTRTSTARRWPGPGSSARRPGWRCGRPRSASTGGWAPTWRPVWRSSGCSSPPCSPPRTAPPA